MAKSSGLGASVTIDDSGGTPRDISNDIVSLTFATPRAEQDVTGVDKSGHERIQLLADGTVGLSGVFNPTANKSHDVFKTVVSTSVARTTAIVIATKTLTLEALYGDYQLARGAGGEFGWQAPGSNSDGALPVWS